MSVDIKHKDLEGLRIDRSALPESGGPSPWARSIILGGIAVVVLLGIAALAYRFVGNAREVEVVRATAEGGNIAGSVVLNERVVSKQVLDDASAKFDSDQQRVNSLEKAFQLSKIGPRVEEIARAKGQLAQAEGQAAYAKSLLDATVIRAPVSGTILERTA